MAARVNSILTFSRPRNRNRLIPRCSFCVSQRRPCVADRRLVRSAWAEPDGRHNVAPCSTPVPDSSLACTDLTHALPTLLCFPARKTRRRPKSFSPSLRFFHHREQAKLVLTHPCHELQLDPLAPLFVTGEALPKLHVSPKARSDRHLAARPLFLMDMG
jgi:hypothetical protein